jgi:hypothetical protein
MAGDFIKLGFLAKGGLKRGWGLNGKNGDALVRGEK